MACKGISGLLHASGAGERSSVLVSPGTLNTVKVILSASFGFEVNHSASAHDLITDLAYSLPLSASFATSVNASKINKVCDNALAATGANSSSSRKLIKEATLYPPCIVPNSSTALTGVISGLERAPTAIFVRKSALTLAASSTPGGIRFSKSEINSSSEPFGGFCNKVITSATSSTVKGFGTTPIFARSSTFA